MIKFLFSCNRSRVVFNGNFTIDVTGDRFYINGREVNYVIEVQGEFGLHKLLPFNLLEGRILKSQRSSSIQQHPEKCRRIITGVRKLR
ncbi:hypothetical protein [Mucilaginibacter paludis]|uniref:hypothetical protein n=1 Tax=Mucilaginibacter paludis TaxID=423351 RepID=UPI000590DB76|nr:hypothetical protein [Mucilaginibacter paludis]